jgi:hypothetical protein
MNKLFTALLLAAALALPVPAAAAPADAAAKTAQGAFAVYENQAYSLKLEYPSTWKAAEGAAGAIVVFLSPLESKEDLFSENVNVLTEDLSAHPTLTVEGYAEIGIAKLPMYITDYKHIGTRKHTLSGLPAQIIEYTGRQGVFQIHILQAMTIADKKAYVVTFTAEEANYERYLPAARRIIDSLAIK